MDGVARLEHARWPSVDTSRPLVVVPVGSCEQHGPHLPLGTDTIVAVALAERAVATTAGAVVGPAVTITASGEHQGFAGTLSIGNAVMEELVVELVRSADWARGVVLVNGHGGNHAAVEAATARLTVERRRVLSWWPRIASGDLHAGHTETSMLLALRPDLVDVSAITDTTGTGPTLGPEVLAELRRHGVRSVSADGVIGSPTGATAEHGHHLLDGLVDDLRAAIASWDATAGGSKP